MFVRRILSVYGSIPESAYKRAKNSDSFEDFKKYLTVPRKDKRAAIKKWMEDTGYSFKDSSFHRGEEDDYIHSPPEADTGAPLYDLTFNAIYPEDVYTSVGLRYYGTGEDRMDQDAWSIIQNCEGLPEKYVKIYRAVRKDGKPIQPGDWVTIVRAYAKEHGMNALRGDYKIVSKTVKAKDLFTSGDSWLEWGYHPQPGVIPRSVRTYSPEDIERVWKEVHGSR